MTGVMTRCDVIIKVIDVNDNVPQFDRDEYVTDLVVGSEFGTVLTKVSYHWYTLIASSKVILFLQFNIRTCVLPRFMRSTMT